MAFSAALFDLDGTLLDSMDVWTRVDEAFFEKRGIPLTQDYARSISGMSFEETARYTIERYNLAQSVSEVTAEWDEMCYSEYAYRVKLKPRAREYLALLKARGLKLAVVTALPDRLYAPALKRNGVYSVFDAFFSTRDARGDKRTGEAYLRAAEMLNAPANECAVFEDIYEGIAGAKRVGMRSVCVRDESAAHDEARIRALCDFYANSYAELISARFLWED